MIKYKEYMQCTVVCQNMCLFKTSWLHEVVLFFHLSLTNPSRSIYSKRLFSL